MKCRLPRKGKLGVVVAPAPCAPGAVTAAAAYETLSHINPPPRHFHNGKHKSIPCRDCDVLVCAWSRRDVGELEVSRGG